MKVKQVILGLGLVLLGSECLGADWTLFDADIDHNAYYDKQSVMEKASGIYRLTVYNKSFHVQGLPWTRNSRTFYVVEHNCNNETMRLYTLTYYEKEVKETLNLTNQSMWHPVPRDKPTHVLHKVICRQ